MYSRERTNKENGQLNYVDKYGLMLQENMPWESGNGVADSLFRTSQAYIAYGETELLDALVNNCIIDDYHRLSRHPLHEINDNSRDQTILFLSALKFNGDYKILNKLIDTLDYKLSGKYKMTPTMWLWMKGLRGSWWANLGYQLMELISLVPSLLVSWGARRIAGFSKEYPQDDVPALFQDEKIKNSLSFKIYKSIQYPSYATHLGSMMIYSAVRIPILTWVINKFFRWDAEDDNYYIRLLNNDGEAINDYLISGFKPMWGVRWSSRLNGENTEFVILNGDKRLNTLDVDLMRALIAREIAVKFIKTTKELQLFNSYNCI